MLQLYNTLSRKKEAFEPLHKGKALMYSCGPTVYWYQHIGNLRAYLVWDLLKRVLRYNGFKVKHVINVTDVGHLTSDEDEGEDKVEIAAKKEGKKASEITRYYFNCLIKDFKKLNIEEPNKWAWATKHIKEQIHLIKILEKKGFTYKTSDGIYFNTSKVKDYGRLAKLNIKKLKAGKRISLKEKKNITDFALWKFSKGKKRQQEWNSPWGLGFPGWHLECSAMSSKYLGKQFDIHTGGEEHVPVHHTNEIAQSESAFGKKPWVRYWLHNAWLIFKGEKMAKSKGNLYTIEALEKKGFKPLVYRYFNLTAHYKTQLNFTFKNLESAQNSYERLKNIISGIQKDDKLNKKYMKEFEDAINNDLDMPHALQTLWKLVRDTKAEGKLNTIQKMDEVFGLDLLKKEKIKIPKEISELLKKRKDARKSKNWKLADEFREKIKKKGFAIDDGPNGPQLRKIN